MEDKRCFVIAIRSGGRNCYFREGDGDPARTLIKENAKVYKKRATAMAKASKLRKEYNHRAFSVEWITI